MQKNVSKNVKKLTLSGITIALYICVMFVTQNFAFGQYQIRIATSIYALAAIHPFLILPLGIANFLSNTIMGGLGPIDMFGGFIVGLVCSASCYYANKISVYLVSLPIILVPTLLVSTWLSYLLNIPYNALVLSVGVGQIIPGIVGILLVKYLKTPLSNLY